MGWSVNHNQEENIMVLTYQGIISFREIVESSIANINQANKYNSIRMLVECTYLKIDANRTELFELPSNLYAKWGMNPDTKIALTKPKDMNGKEMAEFYVFATQNLGWNTMLFPNLKKAMEWLKKD